MSQKLDTVSPSAWPLNGAGIGILTPDGRGVEGMEAAILDFAASADSLTTCLYKSRNSSHDGADPETRGGGGTSVMVCNWICMKPGLKTENSYRSVLWQVSWEKLKNCQNPNNKIFTFIFST